MQISENIKNIVPCYEPIDWMYNADLTVAMIMLPKGRQGPIRNQVVILDSKFYRVLGTEKRGPKDYLFNFFALNVELVDEMNRLQ